MLERRCASFIAVAAAISLISIAAAQPAVRHVALSQVMTVVKDGVVWKKDGVPVDASKPRNSSQR